MEKGVQRWIVDISEWNPCIHCFSFAMSFLPQHEHNSITRFFKMEDRKRALVSRLLQYALIHQVLGISYNEIVIRRTAEGKPYLTIPEKESVKEFIQNFSSYFSRLEWFNIINAGSSRQILSEFYRYWSVKEAFVKAIGDGVGYKLDTIEFHHKNWENIVAKVNGKELKDWRFWLLELGKEHVASIARGHPMYATGSYKTTLNQTQFNDEEYNLGLHLPNTSFIFRKVEDLWPSNETGRVPPCLSQNCVVLKD
ncbi:L-aminoadipate-semialdehyde dehydrogenase-phosphopantetheinyl transferase isoform X2 [Capsicum annuum]|uniref:L-aminoadipate-semialdehyde dehydrogenase-phosphopantetheinyl transferase isoform X2 n=1 Tax=Capsicum annuum TaxID=4072 RepID=UPI001FB1501A|nr:L-aminoadipate-semialdehyde dehydrogenase-phosphopantetheinyl transferase isoform X2 [Capsicum annuum]